MEPLTVGEVLAALRRQQDSLRVMIRNGSRLSNVGHVELVIAGHQFNLSKWHSEQVPAPDQRLVMITRVSLVDHQMLTAGEVDAMICQAHESGMAIHDVPVVLELEPGIGSYFNLTCDGRWLLEPTRL